MVMVILTLMVIVRENITMVLMILTIMVMFLFVTISILFFTGSGERRMRLWDVTTRRKVAVLKGHTDSVTSVAFDVNGKYLASGGSRGVMCDGGVDADNDGDCNGKCHDVAGDDFREHGHICSSLVNVHVAVVWFL
jgi:WD40 repeat protein